MGKVKVGGKLFPWQVEMQDLTTVTFEKKTEVRK